MAILARLSDAYMLQPFPGMESRLEISHEIITLYSHRCRPGGTTLYMDVLICIKCYASGQKHAFLCPIAPIGRDIGREGYSVSISQANLYPSTSPTDPCV